MTALSRVITHWSGFPGGPGTTTMYFLDTATAMASLQTFWTHCLPAIPPDVHLDVQAGGDIIEDTTGEITGSWPGEVAESLVGSGYATYAAPLGLAITWHTATILDGHRVKGRTYLVPISGGGFTDTGSPTSGTTDPIAAAGLELIIEQSASFVVWHRPYAGRAATAKLKAKAAHLGGHALVTQVSVANKGAVLRSRRD